MIAFEKLNVKVIIGLVLGIVAVLIVGAASWNMGEPRWLNCLVSLFGGLLGCLLDGFKPLLNLLDQRSPLRGFGFLKVLQRGIKPGGAALNFLGPSMYPNGRGQRGPQLGCQGRVTADPAYL